MKSTMLSLMLLSPMLRAGARGEPVTFDTVFRIASITKSFTALAVLKLRDANKVVLDAPAAKSD